MRDDGATAVLGAILMMALMMSMVPAAMLMRDAMVAEMDAHREAAERAAFCARHPDQPPPACPERGPMPGYLCEPLADEAWVCRAASPDVTLPLSNATPTPGAPDLATL